jgi:hypothetical protein
MHNLRLCFLLQYDTTQLVPTEGGSVSRQLIDSRNLDVRCDHISLLLSGITFHSQETLRNFLHRTSRCKVQCSFIVPRLEFDSRRYQIFWEVVGLEGRPFSLVSTIEELTELYVYEPEGRGFKTRWGEILNLHNPSGRTRPWGSLSL